MCKDLSGKYRLDGFLCCHFLCLSPKARQFDKTFINKLVACMSELLQSYQVRCSIGERLVSMLFIT